MILNKKSENYWLILLSLPSWECGLKSILKGEIDYNLHRRSLRGSVGWNNNIFTEAQLIIRRSLRGSVGWNERNDCELNDNDCRSLRGSVGWNRQKHLSLLVNYSRSLRGSVDWNLLDVSQLWNMRSKRKISTAWCISKNIDIPCDGGGYDYELFASEVEESEV